MSVEHLTECPDCGELLEEGDVQKLEFCEHHSETLDMLVLERQMQSDERASVVDVMLFGVISYMGPTVFAQHNNCPVCVLEGTLERACDEVSMIGRKSN